MNLFTGCVPVMKTFLSCLAEKRNAQHQQSSRQAEPTECARSHRVSPQNSGQNIPIVPFLSSRTYWEFEALLS